MAVSCQKHELFLMRHHYPVILRILGFQIAHLGSENTSSLTNPYRSLPLAITGIVMKTILATSIKRKKKWFDTLLRTLPVLPRHINSSLVRFCRSEVLCGLFLEDAIGMFPHLGFHQCPKTTEPTHMSHEKKPNLLSIESWMVNDGILIMVYYNALYNWIV